MKAIVLHGLEIFVFQLLDSIPRWRYLPLGRIELLGERHNEHVSRTFNCRRRSDDDLLRRLRSGQGDRP